MKITVTYGPKFERNLNRCLDYMIKRFREDLEASKYPEVLEKMRNNKDD